MDRDPEYQHRRKLLVVRPTLGQGGADRVTITLLQHLDRRSFDLGLALMRAEGEYLAAVPADVPVFDLAAASMWTAWRPLRRVLLQQHPEILFSTSSGANLLAAVSRLTVRPRPRLILSERNVLVRDQTPWKRWLVLLLKRLLYPTADGITAVSQGVKDDLRRRLGLAGADIRVVFNPVVTAEIPRLAREPVSHPWFRTGRPVILAVGRLVPAKGFPMLIRAFELLRRSHDAQLVILGEGPQRRELEQLAAYLGVRGNVSLPGFDPNPFRYMSRCTMFVLSSRFEGLPGALIQAMACGAAVIATDCPSGPSEIIEPDRDGLLVPVDDPLAMCAAMERLLEQTKLRTELASRAPLKVERFTVEAVMKRYEEALTGVSTDSRSRGMTGEESTP